jgi:glycosyltransferase involved in cell wall biosynthesis
LDNKQLSALKHYKKYLDIPLVLSLDDLLTEIPSYNSFSETNPKDIKSRIETALKLVDKLIVTTDYLADKFSHLHKNITVINNLLPKELWMNPPLLKNRNKKLRIGWAGAAQHEQDLTWLAPVISATQNLVQWVFYGYLPDSLDSNLIEFQKHTSFSKYHSSLNALQLDIAIAPLTNNAFNHAKSNLKLLEYGALSLPTICSAIENYKNSPAIQLKNEPELWIQTITDLVNNEVERLELGSTMRKWVCQNYFLEDNLDQWSDALYLNSK